MKLPQSFRSPVCAAFGMAALLAPTPSFAKGHDRTQAQAQVLDRAEFACDNCFFGAAKEYYCFAAGSQILIGYQKTPTMNYTDKSKNFLTGARPAWKTWQPAGETVPISYDAKHIYLTRDVAKAAPGFWAHLKRGFVWASRGKGARVTLNRSTMSDIFINDNRCHVAGGSKTQ